LVFFKEYVPAAYMRRMFLTGFGGSAGTAVVFQNGEALLWTDARYWNEANMQLDADCWTLMKQGQPKVPSIVKKLAETAVEKFQESNKPLRVGIDSFVHPASFAKEFSTAMEEAAKTELDATTNDDTTIPTIIGELDTSHPNLIDPIWSETRPAIPTSPFRVHPLEYAGTSVADKVTKIRTEMEAKKATLAVFSALDDVAYLFNMRAMGDVDTCPVGIAYATVSHDEITLYCDPKKLVSPDVQEHLKEITLKPYDDVVGDIEGHCKTSNSNKVWMDTSRANYALFSVVPKTALVDSQNAVTPMKACKNPAELEGMRQAHIVDGAAMAKGMALMEERIVNKGESISEVEVDEILTGCRAEQPGFLECSFPTIAGVGPNAAIIHYRAQEGELMRYLDTSEPILIDSGGQYTYGTTDVTRTWHFGTPTDEFRDTFTRVLKGNIGVDRMVFPEGTPGFVLDVFARKSLWEAGKGKCVVAGPCHIQILCKCTHLNATTFLPFFFRLWAWYWSRCWGGFECSRRATWNQPSLQQPGRPQEGHGYE
jgi:Xaa-Pro aminopeptidase